MDRMMRNHPHRMGYHCVSIIPMIFLFLSCHIVKLIAIRSPYGTDPLVPDYSKEYYYTHIDLKMNESMSVNNCSLYGSTIPIEHGGALSLQDSDLSVEIIPPSMELQNKWQDQANGVYHNKVYAKANQHLCASNEFRDFRKGYFKRGKGCYKTHLEDKNGNIIKRINRYGATLHPDHIRCDVASGGSICGLSSQGKTSEIVSLPSKFRYLNSFPFIIKSNNVIVAKSGMLALPCGPFGLLSSCEAVNWGISTAASMVDRVYDCRRYHHVVTDKHREQHLRQQSHLQHDTYHINESSTITHSIINNDAPYCPFRHVKKVFLMSQYDDTQIGQFMMESYPRLVYHYDYLMKNPDVFIHFGFTKQDKVPNFALPLIFINWLGFGDRLINGTYYADEVIMSREGGCQDAGYNAWEVVHMRDKFITMLNLPTDKELMKPSSDLMSMYRPSIVILVRSTGSRYVQNKGDGGIRGWPKGFVDIMIPLLSKSFPTHQIKLFSDLNATLMSHPPSQIQMFRSADISIGYHGAGLSNTMYMKPGGVVVEIIPRFDSRHAPGVGIFPRLSGIIGLHHYTYYIKGLAYTPESLVGDIVEYHTKVKMWSASGHVV